LKTGFSQSKKESFFQKYSLEILKIGKADLFMAHKMSTD